MPVGQQLYVSAGCAACHGSQGEGVANLGPHVQQPTDDLFDWIVRNGSLNVNGDPVKLERFENSTMPANSSLTDGQIAAIRDWLQDETEFPKPAASDGDALFDLYCSYCHGLDGAGGGRKSAMGAVPEVRFAYASASHSAPFCQHASPDYTTGFRNFVKSPTVVATPDDRNRYMPAFAGILTDAELDAIFAATTPSCP